MVTIREPHYLLFYSADCKYTAVIRQRLEMPHFSIVTKIFTTLITLDFKSNETINKAKRNLSMSDINV